MAMVHTVPADLDVWERFVLGAVDLTSAEIGHISGLGEIEVERIKMNLRSRGIEVRRQFEANAELRLCIGCSEPFPKRSSDPSKDKFCTKDCQHRWRSQEKARKKLEEQATNLCGSVWWKPGPELLKLCREARCEILAGTSPPLKLV